MAVVKTEYGCSSCEGQIIATDGALVCSLNSQHRWNDTMSFLSTKPQMKFKVEPAKFAPQANRVEMKVMVPLGIKTALETKFAGTLESTVAGILAMLSEGEVLMVPESDLDRIKQRLGAKPSSSGELFGAIYSLSMERDEAKQAAELAAQELGAYEGRSRGSIVISLGDQYAPTLEKAKSAEEPLKQFVQRNVIAALEANWF